MATLATLRLREDDLRARLDAVRERLAACVRLVGQLPEIERRDETAYRTDARDASDPLKTADAARAERERLRIEEAELMIELERIRSGLARRGIRNVALPVLEDVSVATPCDVSWAEMRGDSDTRFCDKCAKHVHNLSMMSRAEAEALVMSIANGQAACIRFYRRADGTMLTQDCPVGVRRQRFWRRTAGIAAAGLLLGALGSLAYANLVGQAVVTPSYATQGFGGGGGPPPAPANVAR